MSFFSRFKRKKDQQPATSSPPSPVSRPGNKLDGQQLKQRYLEFDITWPDEQLQPYYDEAVQALKADYDKIAFWWATHTLHELYRIKSPAFRVCIPKDAADNGPVAEMVTKLHLDSIRYHVKDERVWGIIKENLAALNGHSVHKEFNQAAKTNQVWIELADLLGQYIRPGTSSERREMKNRITALCSRMDSCSAIDKLVNRTVELLQAVNRQQSFGGGIWTQTIDLQTGQRSEVTENPTDMDIENLGVDMLAALGRPLLTACQNGLDYSIDPEREGGNYQLLLNKAMNKLT